MNSNLLPRILIAIVLGVGLGLVMPTAGVRLAATFNAIFGQFLGFLIPLLIVGLVTAAIGRIGRGVGRMLIVTVLIAYADTIVAGLLAYGTGEWLFPHLVSRTSHLVPSSVEEVIAPYFTLQIPPLLDVMSALVLSFVMGLTIAYRHLPTLKTAFEELETVITHTIERAIIPLLPLYIFGIFLTMTFTGQVWRILQVFAVIIAIIFGLHLLVLLYEYAIAGAVVGRQPLRLLKTMLPAYFTALGTSSSAATIPVTLEQTRRNGVSAEVAGFCVPLCATIHMSGSAMKITACALTVCLMEGLPHSLPLFLHFVMMLGVCMVAAPGVPGGAVMAALAPMASVLGFGDDQQALIIALYIAMDSFGTACNVTGDGAIALVLNKLFGKGLQQEDVALPE